MSRIIGGLLCNNEENRWLKQYLEQMKMLCDELVVIDDKSTDNTVKMCKEYTKHIYYSDDMSFEVNESYLRERLFNLCAELCNDNDLIIILDADEMLTNLEKLRSVLLTMNNNVRSFGLRLYDMWNDTQYRDDQYWSAHKGYRYICHRYNKEISYTWNRNKLHCGSWPTETYIFPLCVLDDNEKVYIKHMGWSTEQDRKNKYDRYMKLDGKGEFGILEQYESILDPNPNLVTL